MHFLRCPSCGAKALASASRCPRCTTPFDLLDGRGERMKLYPCRSCEVLLPENVQVCPWCKAERRKGTPVAFLAAAALVLAIGVVAWLRWGRASTEGVAVAARVDTTATPVAPAVSPLPESLAVVDASTITPPSPDTADAVRQPQPAPPSAPIASAPPPVVSVPAAAPAPPLAPTDEWRPATPMTWINVRTAARIDAPILRVVKPEDAVQVGPAVGGWRPVRGSGFSGWAGARHFAVAPPR